jgi:hypothetical protein
MQYRTIKPPPLPHPAPRYQLRLLSSWAVVATVTFLPPQQRRPGESIEAFASRVQGLIADKVCV